MLMPCGWQQLVAVCIISDEHGVPVRSEPKSKAKSSVLAITVQELQFCVYARLQSYGVVLCLVSHK